ncbi:MAG: 50S ribosomal protein L6 [Methanophagales archaeon]|nr:50S ribosomal protein L6 [Methanophagales archaeon]
MGKEAGIEIRIPIPDGVTVSVNGRRVKTEGPKGEIERELWHPGVQIQVEEKQTEEKQTEEKREQREKGSDSTGSSEIVIKTDLGRKKKKAMAGTYASHLKNMLVSVQEGFIYKLKAVHAHFPMQITLTKEGNAVSVANFLGERKPRIAKIGAGVKVEIKGKGEEIVVSGLNKEEVGQTAANIEQATRIKGYDSRVFQDGVYLVEKSSGAGV